MLINSQPEEPPLSKNLSIIIVDDINLCKQMWVDFVKCVHFLDTWDFRNLFTESIGATPYFITLLKGNKFWGAIPLEYLPTKDKYYAFGGGIWNEYNYLYIGNSLSTKEWALLKNEIPKKSDIKFIRNGHVDQTFGLSPQQVTYYLDIPENAVDLDFFLHRLSGSSRRKLQQKMRNIEIAGVKGQIVDYDVSGFIEQYSNQHFGNESTFRSINLRAVLASLNTSNFDVKNIIFTLEEEIVGVALAVLYNNIFYALSVGYSSEVKDLGKYINYYEIDFAVKMGAKRINFFADDCGWKENWKLQKDMLFKYELDDKKLVDSQKYSEFTLMNINSSNDSLNN